MRTNRNKKNVGDVDEEKGRKKVVFRFLDEDHYALIVAASKDAGLSINAWIVQATKREARKQLAASRDLSAPRQITDI